MKQFLKRWIPRPHKIKKWYRRRWPRPAADVFTEIHDRNTWGSDESSSGPGSTLEQTAALRAALPALLERHGVKTLLDLPCGDFHWLREVQLPVDAYVGADIVEALVEANQARYGGPGRTFLRLNLLEDELPPADAILCRDCLVHLSYRDIRRALANIVRSGAALLLTTTFPGYAPNADIITGRWRPLDLEAAPFDLPPPVQLIDEANTEEGGIFNRKRLGVWRIEDIEAALAR